MKNLPTSHGIPYWPNENKLPIEEVRSRSPLLSAVLFLLTFLMLHTLWGNASDSAVKRLWIDEATVKTAVSLVNWVSPEIHAYAQGPRVRAPGGGINVLNGCEGTDVLFLLVAAFMAFPMRWHNRLPGLVLGVVLIFVLNEARILILFYAARSDRGLFDLLHTSVAPIVLIAVTTAYFYVWAYRERLAQAA
jgi:exosortase family protein XrtM